MVLLRDVGQVEARFGLFVDNVSLDARSVHGLRQMYQRFRIILDTPDDTPIWRAQVEARLSRLVDSVNVDAFQIGAQFALNMK
jgi:phage baseplate assembly protein W